MDYFKYANALSIGAHWKLVLAFLGALLATLGPALEGGLTGQEVFNAIQTALITAGAVYFGPANNTE